MTPALDCDDRAERVAIIFWRGVLKLFIPVGLVLAVLWGLLSPNSSIGDLSKNRIRLIEKHTMATLAKGLSDFHTEYGWPTAKKDLTTITDATFVRPLMALDATSNPRRIKFVDLADAKLDRPGLTGYPPALIDQWGQPYHVILDSNGDGAIANPEAGTQPQTQPILKTRAAIYSSGPDRDPTTWKDNITSWR